jgi:photosystem II stability/assembly factor-like uncharacterized protein
VGARSTVDATRRTLAAAEKELPTLRSRTRVVVLVCALLSAACTGSGPTTVGASPTPPLQPSSTSPSPTSEPPRPASRHRERSYINVDEIEAVSEDIAIATYEACDVRHSTTTCGSHVARTTDRGRAWDDITPSRPGGTFEHPDFLDADHGWVASVECAGGKGSIYRTSDGGISWSRAKIAGPSCNAGAGIWPMPVDDRIVFYIWAEPTASFTKLFRSIDGGATFGHPVRLPIATLYAGLPAIPSFVSGAVGWGAGIEEGVLSAERTVDSGRTWATAPLPLPACCRGGSAAAAPVFDGRVGVVPVLGGRQGEWHVQFDRSSDGGTSWHSGPGVTVPGRYAPSVAVLDPMTSWVAARGGVIERTTNGGAAWTRTTVPPARNILRVEPLDGASAWVVASEGRGSARHDQLFLTNDGGRSWRRIRLEAPPFRTVAELDALPMGLLAGPDGSIYAREMAGNNHSVVVRIDPATGHTTSSSAPPGRRRPFRA